MKKTNFTIYLCVLLFALIITVDGQIKIPKILRPTQPPTSEPSQSNQPTNKRRPPSEAIQGRDSGGNLIEIGAKGLDDGFTWFEAVSFSEPVNGKRTDLGWALKSTLRVMSEQPRRSAFKITVSRAGKLLATTRCEGGTEDRYTGVSFFMTFDCFKKETAIKETGKFDVEIAFINGDTDAEIVLRNYKIEVLKADGITGQTTNPIPEPPQYYISRHAEAPVSILFLRPEKTYSYVGNSSDTQKYKAAAGNEVEIYFSLSPSKEGTELRDNYLRCTVDGAPLEMQNDKVEIYKERGYAQIYSDRLAPQFKTSGTPYRDEIGFSWLRAALPFTYGTNAPDAYKTNLSNHPGKYECRLTNNGTTLRTWRWTMLPGGLSVKHPEQNGSVNLFYNSYLIDTEIPAGGSLIDKRLAPVSLAEGFFYGQPWTTNEGKAMAGRVPTKGSPAPVPSNKLK